MESTIIIQVTNNPDYDSGTSPDAEICKLEKTAYCNGELAVKSLGACRIESPLAPILAKRKTSFYNVEENDRVLFDDTASALSAHPSGMIPGFTPAGPRRKIFFDPSKTKAGIVTCGGLCPGFNDVIRGLVMELQIGRAHV